MLSYRRFVLITLLLTATPAFAWNSALVPVDASGRLSYVADANGNRIPDFSHAGYRGGGVALPTVPIVKTLAATAGDQTARIQAALDEVAALPLQADGYRGTLQLAAGTYEVVGTLRLRQSGVVLAGVGNGDDPATNTILRRTGTSQSAIIQAGNRDDQFKTEVAGTRSQITTPRVTVGSRSFEVDHPEYYRVGDPVVIWHPSTQAWLDAVDRGGVTNDAYWRPGEIDIRYHRYITTISGNTITVDAPTFNHLDRSLAQSVLYKYDRSGVLTRLGIEKLQVDIITKGETSEDHAEDAITFVGAEDSWIRDCTMKHFWHAGVQWEGSMRCTAERCRAIEPHSIVTGSRRYNFSMYHSQLILVRDCFASLARHAYVCNGTSSDSGIVFLNCITDRALTSSEGHRRWSTGLLYDGLVATNRQATDILGLYNRGTYGTGHGWASAHSVAWNCNASSGGRIYLQKPPTAQNFAIGCFGNVTGNGPFAGSAGYIEGTGVSGLAPASLYLAQLAQRLAESAAPTITREPASVTVSPNSTAVFTVVASGNSPAYQWNLNGTAIPGATAATFVLPNATAANAGDYTVTITNASGSVTSAAAMLAFSSTTDFGRLINLSILTDLTASDPFFTVGFVIGGAGTSGTKPLLLRAAGPSLIPLGVSGAHTDPVLDVLSGETVIATNDNWDGAQALLTAFSQVGAFAYTSANSKDAATFNPATNAGNYTVRVRGNASATGTVIAELYDATGAAFTTSTPRLINVSVLKHIPASATLTAGFVLGGTTARTVLVRAIGPGLSAFGVGSPLADPQLALFSGPTQIAANDNWGGDPQLTAAGGFTLADAASKDALLLVTLSPGAYTAQVSGVAGSSGTALVEVYEVR